MHQCFHDSNGQKWQLAKEIGTGGEGTLYEVVGETEGVAKVYNVPPDPGLEEKLRVMIGMKNPKLRQFSAWPQRLIRSGNSKGPVAGFLMPYFRDAVQLNDLLMPSDRIFRFPHFSWKDLVQLAENLAKAVAIVHSSGVVMGDLHPENIMVSKTAMPLLIDCDSWQITSPRKTFRRQVLREQFTPPELQGVDFSKIDGTQNHDAFALALMIFFCLFPGQNPFVGSYSGNGSDDFLSAIREHRYAYAKDATCRHIKPPDNALLPRELTPALADLFERAFVSDTNRPTASQWYAAIRDLRKSLVPCSANRRHYHQPYQTCRFCEFETTTLKLTFPDVLPQAIVHSNAVWTLPPACQQVLQSSMPCITFPIAAGAKAVPVLDKKIEDGIFLEVFLTQIFIVGFAFSITCFLLNLTLNDAILLTFSFFLVAVGAIILSPATWALFELQHSSRKCLKQADEVENALKAYISATFAGIPDMKVATALREGLEKSLTQYQDYHRCQKTQFAERASRDFLDAQKISVMSVPGLTAKDVAQLAQAGIETAANTVREKINRLSFLNDNTRMLLLDWRKRIDAAYQPPPYKTALTANDFAYEFKLYHTRVPRELYFNRELNRIQAYAAQLQTLCQPAINQIQSFRAQAETNQELLKIIPRKRLAPFINPSGYTVAALLVAIVGPLSFNLSGLRHFTKPSANIAVAESPQVQQRPTGFESKAPVIRSESTSQVTLKPQSIDTPSSSPVFDRTPISNVSGATTQTPIHNAVKTTKFVDHKSVGTGPGRNMASEAFDPFADYMKAYDLLEQNRLFDGTNELYNAILQSGGKTPQAVIDRIAKKPRSGRELFDSMRKTIEQDIRENAMKEEQRRPRKARPGSGL